MEEHVQLGGSDEPIDERSAIERAHLAAIVFSTDDAVISKNTDGVIESWNPAAERIFGYTADEAIGQSILLLIPQDRREEEEMISARIRRGERIEHFYTKRQTKSGRLVPVSLTISPIHNQKGKVVGASKIARNVEDSIANEALRARMAAIIDSSDDAIVSKDLNGIVQSWNAGAERLFGYMCEEMIGGPITKILPEDRLDEETRILERLRRGERVDHFETIRRKKDGSPVEVSVTISPIRDGNGTIIGASKVARDIGERKMLEATMTRLREELEERVRERTVALQMAHEEMESFTHSVAHDLRGPLRAIASTSSILQEDYGDLLPEEARRLMVRQVSAAKRLSQLIEDLLRYSRLGREGVNRVPIDLSQLARDVAADLSHTHSECEFKVSDGLEATGDANLVRLLLQNLMDNACKFSSPSGPVEVGQKGKPFFVRDHGMGFDMAYADKIFMPFERLVKNEEVPGTGIGLANVKRIVEKHGGAIWVQSVPGQGTTFFFTLP